MGLDNGIICKGLNKKDIPYYVKPYHGFDSEAVDIFYLRKCWGIRNEIVELLHSDPMGGEVVLDQEDLIPIAKIFMKYLDKEYYNEFADSIWEYDEIVDNLKDYIINLIWLSAYYNEHRQIVVSFYDSY